MKKLLYFFFFISLFNSVTAQDYIPLIDESKTWGVGTIGMGNICDFYENPKRYFFMDDTVFNSVTYKKVYAYNSTSISGNNPPYCAPFLVDSVYYPTSIFIREDIGLQKVFRYYADLNEEVLLFDFSLNIGDTMDSYVIDTIYTITTPDGVDRRYFKLGENISNEPYMIEGIGGNSGPFFPPSVYFESYDMLMCVKLGTLEIFGDWCNDLLTVGIKQINSDGIKYYPNPVIDILTIELPNNNTSYKISVFDSFGSVCKEAQVYGAELKLDLSDLTSGVYFVRITSNSGSYGLRVLKG